MMSSLDVRGEFVPGSWGALPVRLPKETTAGGRVWYPADRRPRPPEESVVGAYFVRLTELLDRATTPQHIARAFARQMGSRRFMSALETMAEMDRLYREMRLTSYGTSPCSG